MSVPLEGGSRDDVQVLRALCEQSRNWYWAKPALEPGGRLVVELEMPRAGASPAQCIRIFECLAQYGERVVPCAATPIHADNRETGEPEDRAAPPPIPRDSLSTWDDFEKIRELYEETPFARAIVVTDPPHSRRTMLCAEKVFAGEPVRFVSYPCCPDGDFSQAFVEKNDYINFVFDEFLSFLVRHSLYFDLCLYLNVLLLLPFNDQNTGFAENVQCLNTFGLSV